jgi:hypothetical protein
MSKPTNSELHRTDIHDVLRNDRRWKVLELLSDESPRDLRSLADQIAAAEAGTSPAPRGVRQSVYVTLHQNHLPKLDSFDIVEYDNISKTVALGESAGEVAVYLEIVEDGQLSYSEYYVGVTVLGLVATAAALVPVPGFDAIPPFAPAVAALGALLASLAAQIRQQGSPWIDKLRGRRDGQ